MTEVRNPDPPLCLDFFCGIGGLTIGMERAGVDTVGGIDHWELAARTFEHNLGLPCLVSDLKETTVEEIEEFFEVSRKDVDMIVGGPPCQGFSTVGKRNIDDPRNRLWHHYRDLVDEIRPAYVVIENVEGMIVDNGGQVRDNVIRAFNEIGYHMKADILRSANYGVPQYRKRAIFLGWLDGLVEPHHPEPSHTESQYVSVEEAIFDLPELGPGEKKEEYDQQPQSEYQKQRRKDVEVLHNHEAANHTARLVKIISHVSDGGNRQEIPDEYQPRSGYHNSYSRLASWKPAVAVTSNMRKPSSARCTHPKQDRGLTVREGLRLQTFDDDFVVLGRRTKQYDQVGNAVPPFLAEAIGGEIVKAFQANTYEEVKKAQAKPPSPVEDPIAASQQAALEFPE
jgi:DNA (cytosine-5)-methyltransferase 1